MSFFTLLHQDKKTHARAGIIHTDHGGIETPIFMPVGTQATVKTLDQTDLQNLSAQIILGNTYHLHLRPGEDLISELGGLHKFMNWPKPILTDSGGFQVFSLGTKKTEIKSQESKTKEQGKLVKIDENGVTFQSHIDGSTHRFTPETSIVIQHKLGADIIMAFDECTPDTATLEYAKEALARTHRWAKESIVAHQKNTSYHGYRQFLFGIIQGAKHKELREESARFISAQDFDGIAVGGESIGYNMEATAEILDWVYPFLPADKPHYAMGLGLNPADMLVAVEHGIDMFDCVAPTRLARHGMIYVYDKTNKHRFNIKNAKFAKDTRALEENCVCATCQIYSRAYLHHLFATDEISGMRLASIHNLHVMLQLMAETREAISNNEFLKIKEKWI
jgi:tRNA-guanine transglycosylase